MWIPVSLSTDRSALENHDLNTYNVMKGFNDCLFPFDFLIVDDFVWVPGLVVRPSCYRLSNTGEFIIPIAIIDDKRAPASALARDHYFLRLASCFSPSVRNNAVDDTI